MKTKEEFINFDFKYEVVTDGKLTITSYSTVNPCTFITFTIKGDFEYEDIEKYINSKPFNCNLKIGEYTLRCLHCGVKLIHIEGKVFELYASYISNLDELPLESIKKQFTYREHPEYPFCLVTSVYKLKEEEINFVI